jgi:hypothetical protein
MGYTHYWRQFRPFTTEEWQRVLAESKRICAKAQKGLYSGPEDFKSATETHAGKNCGQIGFAEAGAWRTFEHPECPPPMQGAAIELAGGDGKGDPFFTENEIVLNGKAPQEYETFALDRAPAAQPWDDKAATEGIFNCCKTEYRAYDAVVVSILAAARLIAPDAIKVSSDGGDEVIRLMF